MNKFLLSAIYNAIYTEIKYQIAFYNKDIVELKDLKVLTSSDYNGLNKNKKIFKRYHDNLLELDLTNSNYSIDLELLKILDDCEFDYKALSYLIKILNPYIEYYLNEMKKLIDMVSETLDLKRRSEGYSGEYPVYLKISENKCLIERAIISTNAESYLNKETTNFSYKVTFMEYDVILKDYKYDGKDLRGMERRDILNYLDNKIKVNLNNCIYLDTTPMVIDTSKEELDIIDKGTLSLWLNKKNKTYGGIKEAIKVSLKRSLFTLLILVSVTILIFLFKYLKK